MFLPDIPSKSVRQYNKLPDDVHYGHGYVIYNIKNEKYLDVVEYNKDLGWFNYTRMLFTFDRIDSLRTASQCDSVPTCWYGEHYFLDLCDMVSYHVGHLIAVECEVYTNSIKVLRHSQSTPSVHFIPDFTRSFMIP